MKKMGEIEFQKDVFFDQWREQNKIEEIEEKKRRNKI